MKQIILTQGKLVLVDDEDYNWLNQWDWSWRENYAYRWRNKQDGRGSQFIHMHRLIMNCPKNKEIDHIDGNGLNNQRKNLRICNHSQNGSNRGRLKLNKTGYKGVRIHCGSVIAQIASKGKKYHLGTFPDVVSAAQAYDVKAKKLHGKYARLNFPTLIHYDEDQKPVFNKKEFAWKWYKRAIEGAVLGYTANEIDRNIFEEDWKNEGEI
ncbi:MAG: HNH endonuclease [Candidatus Omnitrophica bacterium]|nr:HNH endonuclease [Candidatus Omnitrophota bacterium]